MLLYSAVHTITQAYSEHVCSYITNDSIELCNIANTLIYLCTYVRMSMYTHSYYVSRYVATY